MKILLFTDLHMCANSSIIRKRGVKYSERLENCIETLTWIEKLALDEKCDRVICLGDFFDKPQLIAEEITAIREVAWNNLPHYILVGNHDSNVNGLAFSTTKALERENFKIISEPFIEINSKNRFVYIPYITEIDRKQLFDYIYPAESPAGDDENIIIFSHNDIKGIQMGRVVSKSGFELDECTHCCNLFLNGHLHNGSQFAENCYNLGNVTGQNFGEDASNYNHGCYILDTDDKKLTFIENPFAFNFYKLNVDTLEDLKILKRLKNNPVVSVRCEEKLFDKIKEELEKITSNFKIITFKDEKESEENIVTLGKIDYIQQFIDYTIEKLGRSDLLIDELSKVVE